MLLPSKGYCSHQAIITLQLPLRQGLRALGMETNRLPAWQPGKPSAAAAPPPWCILMRLRMREHRTLAPDSWGADQRDDFSEPRLLHLSLGRKALNSLTWDIQFSLINSNLLMLQLPGLVYKIPVYPARPPVTSSEPHIYLRGCVPGWSPQCCLPNTT